MRELGLVGLSKDGKFLIARDSDSGDEFQIRADDRLKAAATTDRVRLGQLEIHMESSLSPRDIQTRIRRGESPEAVADAAGVDVDQIIGFAIPVLAEREHICGRARNTVIRRKHVDGAGMALGGLVDEEILSTGGSPESAVWDSWRREDGRWTLVITPAGATESATFIFDVLGRYVTPENEQARQLVGDIARPVTTDMAIADAIRTDSAVRAANPGEGTADADETHPEGVSSLKAARDRRAMEQLALSVDIGLFDTPQFDDEGAAGAADETASVAGDADRDMAVPDMAVPDLVAPPVARKRRERRRVPSWDEIMFGGKTDH